MSRFFLNGNNGFSVCIIGEENDPYIFSKSFWDSVDSITKIRGSILSISISIENLIGNLIGNNIEYILFDEKNDFSTNGKSIRNFVKQVIRKNKGKPVKDNKIGER